MPCEAWHKFFISFCGGDFFQKRALVHCKIKLLFFPRVYNITMFRAYRYYLILVLK